MERKKQNFEESLGELEKIVGKLERGDLSLEESLELFEKGVGLSRECQERLSAAERRIEVLMKNHHGEPALESLEEERTEAVAVTSKVITFNDDDDDDDIPF
jgi:exodeoxyribonuclease VII small subunit